MPFFTLHRDFQMATTKGHVIGFAKDKKTWVPPECIPDALAVGARPEKDSDIDVMDTDKKGVEPQGQARETAIVEAIELLVQRNAREDFTATGIPQINAINELVGFTIDKRERDAAWDTHRELHGDAKD